MEGEEPLSEHQRKLQTTLLDVLNSNLMLCQKSMQSTQDILKTLKSTSPEWERNVEIELSKLWARMSKNIHHFTNLTVQNFIQFRDMEQKSNKSVLNNNKNRLSLKLKTESAEGGEELLTSSSCVLTTSKCTKRQSCSTETNQEQEEVERSDLQEINTALELTEIKTENNNLDDSQTTVIYDNLDKPDNDENQPLNEDQQLLMLLQKATADDDNNAGEIFNQIDLIISDSDSSSLETLDDSDLGNSEEYSESEDSEESGEIDLNSQDKNRLNLDGCREFSFKNFWLEEMDEDQINRLCELHNINRACVPFPPEKNNEQPRNKRIRKLSTSSSESDSDSDKTTISKEIFSDNNSNRSEDFGKEDESLSFLNNSLSEHSNGNTSSIDSDNTEEITNTKKPKKRKRKKLSSSDNENNKENQIMKKVKTWRDDPLLRTKLWSDSDKDSITDGTDMENNKKHKSQKIKEETLNHSVDNKESVLRENVDVEPDFVISDSDTDSFYEISDSENSDIEIVSEFTAEDNSGKKGRRNIRGVRSDAELNVLTQEANLHETERIKRLEEYNCQMELIQSQKSEQDQLVLEYNIGTKEPLIVVDEGINRKFKQHQRDGVTFMWQACYEKVDMIQKTNGNGCILAHCMGLGKTLQVIALIHTLFQYRKTLTRHVLIISPLSVVNGWCREFKSALSIAKTPANYQRYHILKETFKRKCKIVQMWHEGKGVLIMGYEAFEQLISGRYADKISKSLKESVYKALVDPGPDLIVCDEAHLIKNGATLKHKSLMKVVTKRRIALTGTPLQNNLKEFYYIVQFVKPHLLGTTEEFNNRFINPIMNGQYDDSTPKDVKLAKKRTHVLYEILKKTVHRLKDSVLKSYLPEILDYTIFIKLHPVQISIYKQFLKEISVENIKNFKFFNYFNMVKLICLHPFILQKYINAKAEKREPNNPLRPESSNDWWKHLCPVDLGNNTEYGSKLTVLLSIIDEAVKLGDKILIFAMNLHELNCIEHFLIIAKKWVKDIDFCRIDGNINPIKRNQLCDEFNSENNKQLKLLLISHMVGSLGLNLTGANRVILTSSNFNPSYDIQSIFRVFRFGQTKKCYVYRLLSMGSLEETFYKKCVVKLAVASTVIDKHHIRRHFKTDDFSAIYEYNFDYPDRPLFSVPADRLLATLVQKMTLIHYYNFYQSLLENKPEEELNDEDKKLAWEEFNKEKTESNATASTSSASNTTVRDPVIITNTEKAQPVVNLVLTPEKANEDCPNMSFYQNVTLPKPNSPLVPNPFAMSQKTNSSQNSPITGEFNYALNKFV